MMKTSKKSYYESHREQYRASAKKWRDSHREEHHRRVNVWRVLHRERCLTLAKEWNNLHRERHRVTTQRWEASHREERRLSKKEYSCIRRRSLPRTTVILNSHFEGSQYHHLGNGWTVWIPKALHLSIRHSLTKNRNMLAINNEAFRYLVESKMLENGVLLC